MILVSHDMNAIKLLCDKVLLLNNGKCLALGQPESTVNSYNRLVAGFKATTKMLRKRQTGQVTELFASIVNFLSMV